MTGEVMGTVIFGNESSGFLLIEFGRMPAENTKLTEDSRWIGVKARIKAGAFHGAVAGDLFLRIERVEELYKQLKVLYSTLRGEVEFSSMEDWLSFKMTVDKSGHVFMNGYIKDNISSGHRLEYQFVFDQTDLSETIKNFDRLFNASGAA